MDLSQKIKPDWNNALGYHRFNDDVIELPLDPSKTIHSMFKNGTANKVIGKPENSRTSFILLKNNGKYQAFLMTIIADSAYLKNNPAKLALNTYSKRDTNFSGSVLYFTPRGKYVNSWRYKNGHLLTAQNTAATNRLAESPKTLTNTTIECEDWFWFVVDEDGNLISQTYLYTICKTHAGTGDDGGGSAPTPPPCPGGTQALTPQVLVKTLGNAPPGEDPTEGGEPGFPDPNTPPNPSACTTPVVPDVKDSLTRECFKEALNALTARSMGTISQIINMSFGFSQTWNLTFKQQPVITFNGQVLEGSTIAIRDSITRKITATITLSESELRDASQVYIASTIIHEVMHAYFRYIYYGGQDHNLMASSYISNMSAALQDSFGISAEEATALSWGGLNENAQGIPITSAWTEYKNAHPVEAAKIQRINSDYKKAIKGIKCL